MTAVGHSAPDPPVTIVASDTDTNVLAKAANGIYTEDKIAQLSPARIKQFSCAAKGDKAGMVRVRRELRDLISFHQINPAAMTGRCVGRWMPFSAAM